MSNFTLADEYVIDTVGLVLYLEKRKTGTDAGRICNAAENGQTIVHVPTIVLAEIMYLSEKGRISINLAAVFQLFQYSPSFRELPLNAQILTAAERITDIPELHDRLISATAAHLGLELITNDAKLNRSAFVKTVW
jgi:predicted nucleic acid-binding protein